MPQDNEFLWNQFAKLGEMMGDGLHHEPDGAWIVKEYNQLSRILIPDMHKEIRAKKASFIDQQMEQLLSNRKCDCGSSLKQAIKGSKVAYCIGCNKRYKASARKKSQ